MPNLARRVAERIIDELLERNPCPTLRASVGKARRLYVNAVLTAQAASFENYVHPDFQEAFGENMGALLPSIKEALCEDSEVIISVGLPNRGSSDWRLHLAQDCEQFSVPANGDAIFFPPQFVYGLAAYGFKFTSGNEYWPLPCEHVCDGDPESWVRLTEQAHGYSI